MSTSGVMDRVEKSGSPRWLATVAIARRRGHGQLVEGVARRNAGDGCVTALNRGSMRKLTNGAQ